MWPSRMEHDSTSIRRILSVSAAQWEAFCLALFSATAILRGQDTQLSGLNDRPNSASRPRRGDDTPSSVLSAAEWQRVDVAVERGLNFLISQQRPDGSFPTMDYAQPGVTSLC